mmetsp:Transcript_29791/g.68961  ORF Transcript_29791/g.68961 Transcript_29791/m.68961 type:complete len:232 (-) Transcript_29791:28-723(-)
MTWTNPTVYQKLESGKLLRKLWHLHDFLLTSQKEGLGPVNQKGRDVAEVWQNPCGNLLIMHPCEQVAVTDAHVFGYFWRRVEAAHDRCQMVRQHHFWLASCTFRTSNDVIRGTTGVALTKAIVIRLDGGEQPLGRLCKLQIWVMLPQMMQNGLLGLEAAITHVPCHRLALASNVLYPSLVANAELSDGFLLHLLAISCIRKRPRRLHFALSPGVAYFRLRLSRQRQLLRAR